jgi:hypothetical protein
MFELAERELRAAAAGFGPRVLPLAEVPTSVAVLDRIEKQAAGLKLLLAGRMDDAGEWRRRGSRSAAEHLASLDGTSVGAARGALDASRLLDQLPDVAEAVRNWKLSTSSPASPTYGATEASRVKVSSERLKG